MVIMKELIILIPDDSTELVTVLVEKPGDSIDKKERINKGVIKPSKKPSKTKKKILTPHIERKVPWLYLVNTCIFLWIQKLIEKIYGRETRSYNRY